MELYTPLICITLSIGSHIVIFIISFDKHSPCLFLFWG